MSESTSKSKKQVKTNIPKTPYFIGNNNKRPNKRSIAGRVSLSNTRSITLSRMAFSNFDISCIDLAKSLLGKILVRVSNGIKLKGRIVETESYLGGEDKASLSFGGKITKKNKPMFMKPGTIFVYITYGMYNLINISSRGDGAAVLLRALDPVDGITQMMINRNEFQPYKSKQRKETKYIPVHHLCNGPAKLCISLDITKDRCNMQDLSTWSDMWIEHGEIIPEDQIIKSRRIGIDSAGQEWANKLLRFYIINNKCVSKRDKTQEALLLREKISD